MSQRPRAVGGRPKSGLLWSPSPLVLLSLNDTLFHACLADSPSRFCQPSFDSHSVLGGASCITYRRPCWPFPPHLYRGTRGPSPLPPSVGMQFFLRPPEHLRVSHLVPFRRAGFAFLSPPPCSFPSICFKFSCPGLVAFPGNFSRGRESADPSFSPSSVPCCTLPGVPDILYAFLCFSPPWP